VRRWLRVKVSLEMALLTSLAWSCPRAEAQTLEASGLVREPSYQLTWQAPPACPSGTEVSREISELTAASASARQVTPIVANAIVLSDAAGFSMTLTLRDAGVERSRHIGAPTCEELGHATALIVALAIDPALLERRATTGESTETNFRNACHCRLTELPPTPTAALPPPLVMRSSCPPQVILAPTQTQVRPLPREPLFWRLGLGVFGALGTLPGPNLGVSLLGGIQTRHALLDVAVSKLATTWQSTVQGRSAELALYRLAPRACWLVANTTSWAAGPCASIHVGLLTGTGHSADLSNRTERTLWLASSFGGVLELRLSSSTVLQLSADLGVPWLRGDGFELAGETVQESKISETLGANLAAGWP
jgi:hypothetical protein